MTTSTACPDDLAVRMRGLTKRYGETAAVDGVDLDVRRGEVLALLGPNGAGKTTTVEMLEGYRQRDHGEVSVLGQDPGRRDRAWRSRIGIVLQSTADNAELTVGELVRHFAGFYPAPRDPDQVIAWVGLEEKRGARTRSLSGGQRRRLDVALDDQEIARRAAAYAAPANGTRPGVLAKYARLVSGASEGAVTA